MEKVSSIKVSKKLWDKTLNDSRLEINMNGKSVNRIVINTIRRIILSKIPIYCFDKININTNDSVFNNNYMRLRIQNLPVLGIYSKDPIFVEKKVDEDLEEEKDDRNIILDNLDMNVDEKINSSNLKQMTMYINYQNESDNVVTVTTENADFYYAEKKINSPYKNNIPIIKLQPKQKIKMTAITTLGIEKKSSIFSPVSIITINKNSETNYDLILESRGQLNEKKILEYAIINILDILDNFMKMIPENKGMEGILVINDSDHTLGNLLSIGLQKHSAVSFAGYNMKHPLDDTVNLHYNLNSGNLKKVLKDVINYYNKLFNNLKKNIEEALN